MLLGVAKGLHQTAPAGERSLVIRPQVGAEHGVEHGQGLVGGDSHVLGAAVGIEAGDEVVGLPSARPIQERVSAAGAFQVDDLVKNSIGAVVGLLLYEVSVGVRKRREMRGAL